MHSLRSPRTSVSSRALLAASAALILLATAGCGGAEDSASEPESGAASDGGSSSGVSSDGGGAGEDASDGGGANSDSSAEPAPTALPVTPPPKGFSIDEPCSGEGTYSVKKGAKTSQPSLDPRDDGTLDIGLVGVRGEKSELTASLDGGDPRPIEPAAVGDTVTVDLWTLTITSVCKDRVQFDVID